MTETLDLRILERRIQMLEDAILIGAHELKKLRAEREQAITGLRAAVRGTSDALPLFRADAPALEPEPEAP